MDKEKILVPKVIENVTRVMWSDQPILTTARLAEFYETSVDNIQRNFNRNRNRFIEGKHFFRLEGDELRVMKRDWTNCPIAENVNALYLWTKRGAARHAKMLNTERAWDVFEELEDNYFNRPAIVADNQFAALERERLALDRDRITLEQDRLTLDREQFIVANSKETKNFAKAQLLRELASSSGDNQSLRSDLIRHAAKILINEI